MHYTPYHGLASVSNWVKLKFAAMNLKARPMAAEKPSPVLAFSHLLPLLGLFSFLAMQEPTSHRLKSGFFDRLKGQDGPFLFYL